MFIKDKNDSIVTGKYIKFANKFSITKDDTTLNVNVDTGGGADVGYIKKEIHVADFIDDTDWDYYSKPGIRVYSDEALTQYYSFEYSPRKVISTNNGVSALNYGSKTCYCRDYDVQKAYVTVNSPVNNFVEIQSGQGYLVKRDGCLVLVNYSENTYIASFILYIKQFIDDILYQNYFMTVITTYKVPSSTTLEYGIMKANGFDKYGYTDGTSLPEIQGDDLLKYSITGGIPTVPLDLTVNTDFSGISCPSEIYIEDIIVEIFDISSKYELS